MVQNLKILSISYGVRMDLKTHTPMYKGDAGVDDINRRLQSQLTDSSWCIRLKQGLFKVGDRVVQTKNNYEDNVMNGEVGQINFIDKANQKCPCTEGHS